MRLLRIISSIDPRGGGPVEAARNIDRELLRQGHSVEVATLDPPDCAANNETAPVHRLGPARLGYRYSARLVPWLREAAPRFDAVLVNGLWQYHGFAVWRALAGSRTPYFVFIHGMLDPWFKRTYPLKHLKKWLYWPWAEYRVLRDAAAVLFTTEEERRLAAESFWLYRCNPEVISYGTQQPPADPDGTLAGRFLARHPQLRGQRIGLFLGRIHEKKGCDLLIRALASLAPEHPRLRLVIAGPDQVGLQATLQRLAQDLGVADRIVWPGMLEGDDKWGVFHAAEVFCLPSHQENFGVAVAEALGCGKPVLISDKVNVWREVEADGAAIVRPDTVDGTRDALSAWLSLSGEERRTMQASAARAFAERYRVDATVRSLLRVIEPKLGEQLRP